MRTKLILIFFISLVFSCIKNENSFSEKDSYFNLIYPENNKNYPINDTVNIFATYFLENNQFISEDTLSIIGEDLAYFFSFKNEVIDTTDIQIQINALYSYSQESKTISERKITLLPN